MKHLAIRVKGKVQGVFYRAATKAIADALGICGFVRNEPGGDVYIEAESETHVLDKLVSWCRQGPPAAKVEEVTVVEGVLRNYTKFDIYR